MNTRTMIVVAVVAALLTGSGCPPKPDPGSSGTEPKLRLPPDVAGTWKAKDSPWKIVLSEEGTVSSAVIPLGQVDVKPNKTTEVEMKEGSISTYEAGNFTVDYAAQTRELFVGIEMKHIKIVFAGNVIEGNSTDRFIGKVSEDGKEWTTDWIEVFDYGPRFPQDPNDVGAVLLVFEKVEE